jgi:uncharacterized protein YdbL (DUF1318 family)
MTRLTAIILAVAMSAFTTAGAAEADEIKDRMKARKPAIEKLKASKHVGENNLGLLTAFTDDKEHKKLADAENADRKKVYAAIAKKTGSDAALVGKRRAKQLRGLAAKDHKIQDEKGNWTEKK